VKTDGSYQVEGNLDTTANDVGSLLDQEPSQRPIQRTLGGETPTPEEVEGLINYPTVATPTPRSSEVVAQTLSAPSEAVARKPSVQRPVNATPSPQEASPGLLTAQDLRGLNPEQVNQVIGRSLEASRLEAQVMGLAGRDISSNRQHQRLVAEAQRREAATTATALATAKHKAAETIAKSNLLPAQQEVLFGQLDQATTLEQARAALVNSAKLPPLVTSAQERDDYARAQFGGRSYGQLTSAEQAQVNTRITNEKATFSIQSTPEGLFRINQRTGEVFQVGAGDV
jgi:hypothetical protein